MTFLTYFFLNCSISLKGFEESPLLISSDRLSFEESALLQTELILIFIRSPGTSRDKSDFNFLEQCAGSESESVTKLKLLFRGLHLDIVLFLLSQVALGMQAS